MIHLNWIASGLRGPASGTSAADIFIGIWKFRETRDEDEN